MNIAVKKDHMNADDVAIGILEHAGICTEFKRVPRNKFDIYPWQLVRTYEGITKEFGTDAARNFLALVQNMPILDHRHILMGVRDLLDNEWTYEPVMKRLRTVFHTTDEREHYEVRQCVSDDVKKCFMSIYAPDVAVKHRVLAL